MAGKTDFLFNDEGMFSVDSTYDKIRKLRNMNRLKHGDISRMRKEIDERIDSYIHIEETHNGGYGKFTRLKTNILHPANSTSRSTFDVVGHLEHIMIKDDVGLAKLYGMIFTYIDDYSYKNTEGFSLSFYKKGELMYELHHTHNISRYFQNNKYYTRVCLLMPLSENFSKIAKCDSFVALLDNKYIEGTVSAEEKYIQLLQYKVNGDEFPDAYIETLYRGLINK